jgi:hypothetical protein
VLLVQPLTAAAVVAEAVDIMAVLAEYAPAAMMEHILDKLGDRTDTRQSLTTQWQFLELVDSH